MNELKQRMVEDLHLAGYAAKTVDAYVGAVRSLSRYHGRSPDQLNEAEIRPQRKPQGMGSNGRICQVALGPLRVAQHVPAQKRQAHQEIRLGLRGLCLLSLADQQTRQFDEGLLRLLRDCRPNLMPSVAGLRRDSSSISWGSVRCILVNLTLPTGLGPRRPRPPRRGCRARCQPGDD